VASCDYTLIGEEFFAASAYLTGSPEELGSLKGQDVGKVLVAIGIVLGVVFATLASITGPEGLNLESYHFFQGFVDYLQGTVLH
jgi:multisubunit Na+/H+ antiporter MnhB subunit